MSSGNRLFWYRKPEVDPDKRILWVAMQNLVSGTTDASEMLTDRDIHRARILTKRLSMEVLHALYDIDEKPN